MSDIAFTTIDVGGYTVRVNSDYKQVQDKIVAEFAKHKNVFDQIEAATMAKSTLQNFPFNHKPMVFQNFFLYKF